MSEPNTSIKGKVFLLVIILFACIGIIPITSYIDNDKDNKYIVKNLTKEKTKKVKKQKPKKSSSLPKRPKQTKETVKNNINTITNINTSEVDDITKYETVEFDETVPEEVYSIINDNQLRGISNTTIISEEMISQDDKIIPNIISEEERISNNKLVPVEDEFVPIGSNMIDTDHNLLSNINDPNILNTIEDNVISEEQLLHNTLLEESTLINNLTTQPTDQILSISSEDETIKAPNLNIQPHEQMNTKKYLDNIKDINLPGSMIININETPYLNNINILSKSDENKKQIGIWYTSPTTFLKIDETSAKLYIQTVHRTIVPAVIEYTPVFSGGIFISSKFVKYKNRAIEFKYDINKDSIELKYINSETNKEHTLSMMRLSKGLCKRVLHKIKNTSISPENAILFLEVLH